MSTRRAACIFLVSLLLFLSLWSPAAMAEGTDILLSFVGDCTLGSEEHVRLKPESFDSYIQQHGHAYPFSGVRQVFENDDVTVINLENVFYDSESHKAQKTYNFRGPTAFTEILTQGSVELSFLGNNHTMDYGLPGFESTVHALEAGGHNWFAVTDHSVKTWIYEKDGIKVGFTGLYFSYWIRGLDRVKDSLQQLKDAGCDVIVAVMHGGGEYAPRHGSNMERLAKFLIKYGANLVVGHHPHVLHGVEVHEGASIVYSLGNFSFGGNKQLRVTDTMIAQATLRFDAQGRYLGHQLNLLPAHPSTQLDYNDYRPVLAQGEEAQRIIAHVSRISPKPLKPYQDGIGAVQDFVPALTPPHQTGE